MFKIKFLPARFGDSIWIEYGLEHAPHRILIDGGTAGTRHEILKELQQLPVDERRFELLVVTHIDRDHIEGILSLLSRDNPGFVPGEVWYNGWQHLPSFDDVEPFGAIQGERLTKSILKKKYLWNQMFDRGAVCIPEAGPLPRVILPGGLELTLLSPTKQALSKLKPVWEQEVRAANLDPGFGLEVDDELELDETVEAFGPGDLPDVPALADSAFEEDDSVANGSSIALLAEFEGKRILLAADAHAGDLQAALDLLSPTGRMPLDLFKVSHHGSRNTTSRELVEKVDCRRYIFSTNGSNYKHPHWEAVGRVIAAGGEEPLLIFNYRSDHNQIWDSSILKRRYHYATLYPNDVEQGIEVQL